MSSVTNWTTALTGPASLSGESSTFWESGNERRPASIAVLYRDTRTRRAWAAPRFVSHLFHAAAIDAGLGEVALVAYGSTQRSGRGRLVTGSEADPYEAPYNPCYPVSMYALAVSRQMHEYDTTREQLAEVAVTAREWAKLNPKAFMREDLTVEDVLASRTVSSPLRVRDCCLVTDRGGAAIVTSAERARVLKETPIYL